jgi:nucleoside-diphosphate-sugar epimerase
MMVKRSINNIPLTLYGDGKYIRDYIYINDVIYAFLAAAQSIDKINGEHFYIGSGKGHSIAELFSIISERTFVRTGYRPAIRHEALPDNSSVIEKRNFISNIRKFVSSTGWEPTVDLQEGLDLTIEYFLNQII